MAVCSCGCGALPSATGQERACECGCSCCGEATTPETEVEQLEALRQAVERRLAELRRT